MRSWGRGLAVALACASLVPGGVSGQPAPIRIGAVLELSGPLASHGTVAREGIRVAVDEINRTGGVRGRPLELIVRDTRSTPQEAMRAAGELIARERASLLFGPLGRAAALAVGNVARDARVPVLFTGRLYQSAIPTAKPHRYAFHLVPDIETETGVVVRVIAQEAAWRRAAIIAPDTEVGRAQAAAFTAVLRGGGRQADVVELLVRPTEGAFAREVRAMRSKRVDVVYSTLAGPQAAAFLRVMRRAGEPALPVIQRLDATVLALPAADLPGSVTGLGVMPVGHFSPVARPFVAAFQQRTGRPPDETAALALEAVWIATQAMRRAARPDADALVDALERETFQTFRSEAVRFRHAGHVADAPMFVGPLRPGADGRTVALVDQAVRVDAPTLMPRAARRRIGGPAAPAPGPIPAPAPPVVGRAPQPGPDAAGGQVRRAPAPAPRDTGPPTLGAADGPRVYNAFFAEGGKANGVPSELDSDRTYTLRFYVGVPRPENLLHGPPLDRQLQALAEQDGVTVDIVVFCRFCPEGAARQQRSLLIGKAGNTDTVAFPITPVTPGPSRLIVAVQHGDVMVESFNIPVHVGPGAVPRLAAAPRAAPSVSSLRRLPTAEVSISFARTSGDRYQVRVWAPRLGLTASAKQSVTAPELEDLVRDTWTRLRMIVTGPAVGGYSPQEMATFTFQPDRRDVLLRELAGVGREMYRKLFLRDPSLRPVMRDLQQRTQGRRVRVFIESPDIYLPWALLYDDPATDSPRPDGFWGYRYVLGGWLYDETTRTVGDAVSSYPLNVLFGYYRPEAAGPVPSAGHVRDFVALRQDQLGFFRKHAPHLQLTEAGSETRLVEELRRQQASLDIIYVYAHGSGAPVTVQGRTSSGALVPVLIPQPARSEIQLTPRPPGSGGLRPDDLDRLHIDEDVRLAISPIVFLNVCEGQGTAAISPENFVRKFVNMGARTVIASDAEVWQNFGRDYAVRFFSHLLDPHHHGEIGRLMLELRREYLDTRGNPFAFLYTQWGYARVRSQRP